MLALGEDFDSLPSGGGLGTVMAWKIKTDRSADQVRRFLQRHEPWRANIEFSNGVSTREFKTKEPWQNEPLRKIMEIEKALGAKAFRGKRVLDVGFNCGCNAIYLAQRRHADVTGIDVWERHKDVAETLAAMSGVSPSFLISSVEEFESPDEFDVILHLGTLYHLENPLRSVRKTTNSLKAGGHFVLATEIFIGGEELPLCEFRAAPYPSWVMSKRAIEMMLPCYGLENIKLIREVQRNETRGRAVYTARKSMA
jgi:2-polyprenyl-3-methyl-5-hydroxy-6-metoxy-1,4-benzoquinol methylase